MKILIAPNAFKHSLSAIEIAKAIQCGFENADFNAEYELMPIADGGEGLTDILVTQLKGNFIKKQVADPLNRKIETKYGVIHKDTAVIEVASASGLRWLKKNELNPLKASAFGTGELILDALEKGYRKFVIGLGNSATVDAGAGILQALGAKFLDKSGNEIDRGGEALLNIDKIDLSQMDYRLKQSDFKIACDVENTLLGELGAAKVFGPQKGADETMVNLLEDALTHFSQQTEKHLGKNMANQKHGGAAGGIAASMAVYLNAEIVSGIEFLLNLTGFNQSIKTTDLLITAEGGLDEQTLAGKGPYGVAKMAKAHGVPVIVLAGQISQTLDLKLFKHFDAVFPIGTGPVSLDEAIQYTEKNIIRTASQIAKTLSLNILKHEN